jgi:ATP synthase protein I
MKPWVAAFGIIGMGFYIPICIILGVLGGRWLDDKFNSRPLWVIIGLILGIAVAVYGTYNTLKPFIKSTRNGDNKKVDKDNQ